MSPTTEQKRWLESVQDKTIFELCNEDFFKNKLPFVRGKGEARDAWDKEENRLDDLFWLKLEDDRCPSYLPDTVRASIRSRAWEEGHAYGYHNVANVYDDWADFAAKVWEDAIAFVKATK